MTPAELNEATAREVMGYHTEEVHCLHTRRRGVRGESEGGER